MKYGILDITKVVKSESIVKCNNCDNFFYEDISDERDINALEIFYENNEFYKGCPICKTDNFLSNVNSI